MLWLQFAIVLLLILFNGVFAMAELAVVSARRSRLETAVEEHRSGAKLALELKRDPSRFLSTVQIGITIIGVLTGVFGGATLADSIAHEFETLPGWFGEHAHAEGVILVVVGISFVTVVLGELVPKRVALLRPEAVAQRLSLFLYLVSRVTVPAEWVLSRASDLILRLLPLPPAEPTAATDREIALLLRESTAAGHFEVEEHAIIQMALRLGDRSVDTVMTPRTQLEWLNLADPVETNRRKIIASDHSRFPVVEGDSQNVLGVVQVKDLLAQAVSGKSLDIRSALRPPLYLPENVTPVEALEVFRKSGAAMLFAVDEYGDVQGIVTLHDILQSLVGDIVVRGSMPVPSVIPRDDGSLLVDGMAGVNELRDTIGLPTLPGEDKAAFHTLGGFIMARLNRVPEVGDRVIAGGFRFEVQSMAGRRVARVAITPPKMSKL